MADVSIARRLVLLGAVLVLLGLLTGLVSSGLANPRMGLASHLAALTGGTLLIALGAAWAHVRLSAKAESATFWLLAYGSLANWLATLLAAIWGAGQANMPLAAGAHQAQPWQEVLVTALLISLSLALVLALVLVIKGLLARRA